MKFKTFPRNIKGSGKRAGVIELSFTVIPGILLTVDLWKHCLLDGMMVTVIVTDVHLFTLSGVC